MKDLSFERFGYLNTQLEMGPMTGSRIEEIASLPPLVPPAELLTKLLPLRPTIV
jgi:hypothetical protein